jgi:hypothetical protein
MKAAEKARLGAVRPFAKSQFRNLHGRTPQRWNKDRRYLIAEAHGEPMTSGLPLPIVTSWASAIGYRRSLRLCVLAITFGRRSIRAHGLLAFQVDSRTRARLSAHGSTADEQGRVVGIAGDLADRSWHLNGDPLYQMK